MSIDATAGKSVSFPNLPLSLPPSLSAQFSNVELGRLHASGLIGENGLIGTNGLVSPLSYGGVPESVLWQIMRKKPRSSAMQDGLNVAMNAILYRIECLLRFGLAPSPTGTYADGDTYLVGFRSDPANRPFNVDDPRAYALACNLPFLDGVVVRWREQRLVDALPRLFVAILSVFNTFCEHATRQGDRLDDVTTPPPLPSPTIVRDTIARFASIVDAAAFAYTL